MHRELAELVTGGRVQLAGVFDERRADRIADADRLIGKLADPLDERKRCTRRA